MYNIQTNISQPLIFEPFIGIKLGINWLDVIAVMYMLIIQQLGTNQIAWFKPPIL